MKIYPISGFRSSSFKQNHNDKHVSRQTTVGSGSPEVLSNYNRANVNLSFEGSEARNIKSGIKKTLREKHFKERHIDKISSSISHNASSARLQKEIIDNLLSLPDGVLKIPDIAGYRIAHIMDSMGDDYETLKIKNGILSKLVQERRFRLENIQTIVKNIEGESRDEVQFKSDILNEILETPKTDVITVEQFFAATSGNSEKCTEMKRDFLRLMSQNRKLSVGTMAFAVHGLSYKQEEITAIQIDLAKTLLESNRFNALNARLIPDAISCVSDNENIAKMQLDLVKQLLEDERFCDTDISYSPSIFRNCSEKEAKITRDLISELIKNENLNGYNIKNITSGLNAGDAASLQQRKFILKLAGEGFFDNPAELEQNIINLYDIKEYISKRPDVDIEGVLNYMKEIDFEKIEELVPMMKQFGYAGRLTFSDYHFRTDKKTEFSEDDLIYQGDLTELLSNNYFNKDSLNDLYSIFPFTKREVGKIPEDWLDCVSKEKQNEATKKIYEAIHDFQQDKDTKSLAEKMQNILGRNVEIEQIGGGVYGFCHKISIEGKKDTCLKIFYDYAEASHGASSEVQAGLFANRYSPDFVRMYFGLTSPGDTDDGFLVTQFLNNIVAIDKPKHIQREKYHIRSADAHKKHNIIRGKIFDFGGMKVYDYETRTPAESYDFFKNINKKDKIHRNLSDRFFHFFS